MSKIPPSSSIWTFFPVNPRLLAETAVAQEEDPEAKVTPTPRSQTRILIRSGAVIEANCTFVRSGNRGQPELDWDKVPLAKNIPTLELPIEGAPSATGMGNPHCTFFVEDAEKINLKEMGPKFENHPLFPGNRG